MTTSGKSPCIRSYMVQIYGSGQPYVHGPTFDEIPANNTVHTPYIYGSGQPYMLHTTEHAQSPLARVARLTNHQLCAYKATSTEPVTEHARQQRLHSPERQACQNLQSTAQASPQGSKQRLAPCRCGAERCAPPSAWIHPTPEARTCVVCRSLQLVFLCAMYGAERCAALSAWIHPTPEARTCVVCHSLQLVFLCAMYGAERCAALSAWIHPTPEARTYVVCHSLQLVFLCVIYGAERCAALSAWLHPTPEALKCVCCVPQITNTLEMLISTIPPPHPHPHPNHSTHPSPHLQPSPTRPSPTRIGHACAPTLTVLSAEADASTFRYSLFQDSPRTASVWLPDTYTGPFPFTLSFNFCAHQRQHTACIDVALLVITLIPEPCASKALAPPKGSEQGQQNRSLQLFGMFFSNVLLLSTAPPPTTHTHTHLRSVRRTGFGIVQQ